MYNSKYTYETEFTHTTNSCWSVHKQRFMGIVITSHFKRIFRNCAVQVISSERNSNYYVKYHFYLMTAVYYVCLNSTAAWFNHTVS